MTPATATSVLDWQKIDSRSSSFFGLREVAFIRDTLLRATSAYSALVTPKWREPVERQCLDLVRLPENWDLHGGRPIDRDTVVFAVDMLTRVLRPSTPPPYLVPASYGGLQAEWHEKGIDLEIEVVAPNRVCVSYEDSQTGVSKREVNLVNDFSFLYEPVKQLTERPVS